MTQSDDTRSISCSRCGREWDLAHEANQLGAGGDARELFAMDHERHTGHYPDDVTPWIVDCQRCPDGDTYLAERPARRWAGTHARHTGHGVLVRGPDGEESLETGPE